MTFRLAALFAALVLPAVVFAQQMTLLGVDSGNAGPVRGFTGVAAKINMMTAANHAYESASWTKFNVQDATFATKTTAPDGTGTGEKLIENTAASVEHYVFQQVTKVAASLPYTEQAFLKQGERTRAVMQLHGVDDASGAYVVFDLAACAIGNAPLTYGSGWTAVQATIAPAANGWCLARLDVVSNTATGVRGFLEADSGSGTGALSNVYTGNGTSGIYLWNMNIIPTPAVALGQVFAESFANSNDIDLNDTGNAGFTWYTHAAWPNVTPYTDSGGSGLLTSAPATPAGAITTGASGLILSDTPSQVTTGLMTTRFKSSAPGYVGTTFAPGGLFEVSMAFNVANAASGQTSWPIFWIWSQEFLNGTASEGYERDVAEYFPTGAGTGTFGPTSHDWHATQNAVTCGFTLPDTAQHVYDTLWITTTQNNGTGYIQAYVDGVVVGSCDHIYTATTGSTPASTPANPNGIYFISESHHFPLILGTFHNPAASTTFKNVQVWH